MEEARSICLVVVPLIALMIDKVASLIKLLREDRRQLALEVNAAQNSCEIFQKATTRLYSELTKHFSTAIVIFCAVLLRGI